MKKLSLIETNILKRLFVATDSLELFSLFSYLRINYPDLRTHLEKLIEKSLVLEVEGRVQLTSSGEEFVLSQGVFGQQDKPWRKVPNFVKNNSTECTSEFYIPNIHKLDKKLFNV